MTEKNDIGFAPIGDSDNSAETAEPTLQLRLFAANRYETPRLQQAWVIRGWVSQRIEWRNVPLVVGEAQ